MRKERRLRYSKVLSSILFTATLVLIAPPMYAQQLGRWAGTTSQGLNIRFIVTLVAPARVVTNYNVDLVETCPSGAQPRAIAGFDGFISITDRRFILEDPPQDAAANATLFTGEFISDVQARGTFNFLDGRLRVEGKLVAGQACEADVTWEATWQGPENLEENDRSVLFGSNRAGVSEKGYSVVYHRASSEER